MKKIIYKGQVEVFLGNTIQTNNMMVEVTDKLIELNPDLFKVVTKTYITDDGIEIMNPKITKVYVVGKDDLELREPNTYTGEAKKYLKYFYFRNNALAYIKECKEKKEQERQELLAEAKRKYPIGTKFKSINSLGNIYTIEDDCLQWSPYYPHYITCGPKGVIIYTKDEDKWAEILPLKFTTEDGVDIYSNMETYAVDSKPRLLSKEIYSGNLKCWKYFYHKEKALEYIKENTQKTLEDYENILLSEYAWTSYNFILTIDSCTFYGILKEYDPKLYYTKILQLIADDLNGDWEADFDNDGQTKYYHSDNERDSVCWEYNKQGTVYFKNVKSLETSRELLGDNMKHLFN